MPAKEFEASKLMTPEEVDDAIKRSQSILKDYDREEFFIFLKGSVNKETGEVQGSSSFFSLKEVLDEYYSLKRKHRKKYGIWDVPRGFPLDIVIARDTGMRVPATTTAADGEVIYKM
ncbi:MAG: hypothetical protein KBT06_04335 [Prevotellaceae bacterium]|nr:hypothetical protein [Candidatus Colivivens equi]